MTPPSHYERREPRYLPPRARMHCPLCDVRTKMLIIAWPSPASAVCPRCGYEWEA